MLGLNTENFETPLRYGSILEVPTTYLTQGIRDTSDIDNMT